MHHVRRSAALQYDLHGFDGVTVDLIPSVDRVTCQTSQLTLIQGPTTHSIFAISCCAACSCRFLKRAVRGPGAVPWACGGSPFFFGHGPRQCPSGASPVPPAHRRRIMASERSQVRVGNIPQSVSEPQLLAELEAYHIRPLRVRLRYRDSPDQASASKVALGTIATPIGTNDR